MADWAVPLKGIRDAPATINVPLMKSLLVILLNWLSPRKLRAAIRVLNKQTQVKSVINYSISEPWGERGEHPDGHCVIGWVICVTVINEDPPGSYVDF
jgi:hypothetical protein